MMKAQLTLALALLLLCTGAVLAQTPDGQTPAEETVCDHESGAAFGLCNAYCEAMDCDSANPQASATASRYPEAGRCLRRGHVAMWHADSGASLGPIGNGNPFRGTGTRSRRDNWRESAL